ncbi:hypothetical protein GHT06_019516 [Daphnia sinensis]|uniref:Chorion peroxidase n=1 Tax=Daphnia sinensis TaxID=1820382 RepID=A0AAD5KKV9_9CRUS|nr:hypothetical protein GHT06_019516 [Daphnia sinensis]
MTSWSYGILLMGLCFVANHAYTPHQTRPQYTAQNRQHNRVPAPPHGPPARPETVFYCPNVGGRPSRCRPIKDCAAWYEEVLATPNTACRSRDGSPGSCCPDLPFNIRGTPFIEPSTCESGVELDYNGEGLDVLAVNEAASEAELELEAQKVLAKRLQDNHIVVQAESARATHARFAYPSKPIRNINNEAFLNVHAASVLVKRFQIKSEQVGCALQKLKLSDTDLTRKCSTVSKAHCSEQNLNSPFRTIDGSCNNKRHFVWGRSATQYHRILPSHYADGIWAPRISINGSALPSARLISSTMVGDENKASGSTTIWFMQYGQFLDHDIVSTPEMSNDDGSPIPCCKEDGKFLEDENRIHGKCLPIEVPENDPFYSRFGRTCIPLIRANLACRTDGKLGHAEQLNGNTHFIDLSLVYGSDDQKAGELRSRVNGELSVFVKQGPGFHKFDLLPQTDSSPLNGPCSLPKAVTGVEPPENIKCFKAGDGRPDVTPAMATTQIIFLREHNRLARELARWNPHWDDERLYQEARRILIAQAQHITYNEWLPILLGRTKMAAFGLLPLQSGFSRDYDEQFNPSILSEFVGAAFRFGHSLIQGKTLLVNKHRGVENVIFLREHYFKPQLLYTPGNLDKFLIGLASQPTQKVDLAFTKEVTEHLFEKRDMGFGLDLVALNIQRGRDFGLRSYNAYREVCGLGRAKDFDGLADVMNPERFKSVYNSVDDIDLFIGGVSETKAENSYVGPTFRCILTDQFMKLKRGDRYFYDLGGQSSSFTEGIDSQDVRTHQLLIQLGCRTTERNSSDKSGPNYLRQQRS